MSTSCRPSALIALLVLGYITSTLAAPAPALAARATGVCGSFPYNLFLPLSAYAPAESYCSSHYPIPTSTITITASASTAHLTITVSTDTTTSDIFSTTATSTAPTTTFTASTVSTDTTTTTTTTTTSTDTTSAVAKRATSTTTTKSATGIPAILSSLESQGASLIKTACSCIETTPVTTRTVTPTSTSTSTVTAVSTVTVDSTVTSTQVTTPISTTTPTTVSTTTTTTTSIFVTTTLLACVPTSTQVLGNPDFELGTSNDVTDWKLIGGDPFTSKICCYPESGSYAIIAAADNSGTCGVSQNPCVTVGSSYTISAYYGYAGGTTPNAPVFNIVFEGVTVFTSNVCGPGTTDFDGSSCNGDGNQHYFPVSVNVTPTTSTPTLEFQFVFSYTSGQAYNGLVDNTSMKLN